MEIDLYTAGLCTRFVWDRSGTIVLFMKNLLDTCWCNTLCETSVVHLVVSVAVFALHRGKKEMALEHLENRKERREKRTKNGWETQWS